MTGPGRDSGGPAPVPGWYPDPDGSVGLVRWWTGAGWSDVTAPAGPGVSVGAAFQPVLPHHRAAPTPTGLGGARGPRTDRRRAPWILGGVLLVVLALVLLTVALTRAPGGTPTGPLATGGSRVTPSAGPTFPPGTVRIVDTEAGISYPYLGEGWSEYVLGMPVETTSVRGQYFITQGSVPGGGEFIAQITSGPVADGYGWTGPDSLPATARALAASARGNYYPAPNDLEVLREEPVTVDGAPAQLYEFTLSWDVAGYEASGERAAMLLVDVGRPAPALLYLSIPNTHAELYGVIDRVIGAVQVL